MPQPLGVVFYSNFQMPIVLFLLCAEVNTCCRGGDMRVVGLSLKNAKSFGQHVELAFSSQLNILIGPNGGGKSNLLDILNYVLAYYFVHPWRTHIGKDGLVTREWAENRRTLLEPWQQYLDRHNLHPSEVQDITIALEITRQDVDVIGRIHDCFDDLRRTYEQFSQQSVDFRYLQESLTNLYSNIKSGQVYRFHIQDNTHTVMDQAGRDLLTYLNHYDLFVLCAAKRNIQFNEALLFFGPFRDIQVTSFTTCIANLNYYDLREKYKKGTSRTISSLIELSNFYFSQKMRLLNDNTELFLMDREVMLVREFLERLGYDFSLVCVDKNTNTYQVQLSRAGVFIDLNQTSSGEREIINFLFGMSSFNISGGVVLIDEPELHLHPKWQLALLDLLRRLADEKNVQFFVVTHSPQFVGVETITNRNVIRIYKQGQYSNAIVPHIDFTRDAYRNLFHLINQTNNSKIFFADVVILVEGLTDRLVLSRILNRLADPGLSQTVEVLDIGGKRNFPLYREFLDQWGVRNYFVGDCDCLIEFARDMKPLFLTDYKKIDEVVLKGAKTCQDAKHLSKILDVVSSKLPNTVLQSDIDLLRETMDYIASRFLKLREDLSSGQIRAIHDRIDQLQSNGIFILSHGELEDYFPALSKNAKVESVLEFLNTGFEDWWQSSDTEQKLEILFIAHRLLDR